MAIETEVLIERAGRPVEGMKISWGGVFGGVLAGIGSLLLLASLGFAIGITATDPMNPDGSALGTGAAIWTGVTLLIALFIAGWASTRLSMLWERTTAMFEGVLVWVLSMILVLYMTANGIGLIASGAFGVLGGAAQAVSSSAESIQMSSLSSGSVDDIVERMRDPQTARMVASATGMSTAEASSTLNDIGARIEAARNNPAEAVAEARQGVQMLAERARMNLAQTAQEVHPEATATAWVTFGALVLSLLAAVGGAAVGRQGVARKV